MKIILFRLYKYIWALPNSILGVILGLIILCLGGHARFLSGALEFYGGLFGRLIRKAPAFLSFEAVTLGHVLIGINDARLESGREHEHIHIRQYERWGPFFLPAYAMSSLWQIACRRRWYRDNIFEREAYALERQEHQSKQDV
jgi:hypothetical protein